MGTLLMARMNSKAAKHATPGLMWALLLAITFVIPTSGLHLPPRANIVMQSAQKVFLWYAIGFVILAITTTVGFHGK